MKAESFICVYVGKRFDETKKKCMKVRNVKIIVSLQWKSNFQSYYTYNFQVYVKALIYFIDSL